MKSRLLFDPLAARALLRRGAVRSDVGEILRYLREVERTLSAALDHIEHPQQTLCH